MAASPYESGPAEDEPARPDPARLDEGMGSDEVELEMAHGREVWDGPQGDLAEDVVAMRELDRRGLNDYLFADLASDDDLRRLLDEAHDRGDDEAAAFYFAAIVARDPERFWRRLDEAVGEGGGGRSFLRGCRCGGGVLPPSLRGQF